VARTRARRGAVKLARLRVWVDKGRHWSGVGRLILWALAVEPCTSSELAKVVIDIFWGANRDERDRAANLEAAIAINHRIGGDQDL
jgi:hypothetical protein